jgi:hypothetical protein
MQESKNWILPKKVNTNRIFRDFHWLEIWNNHLYPSVGQNGGSVAMDSSKLMRIRIYLMRIRIDVADVSSVKVYSPIQIHSSRPI